MPSDAAAVRADTCNTCSHCIRFTYWCRAYLKDRNKLAFLVTGKEGTAFESCFDVRSRVGEKCPRWLAKTSLLSRLRAALRLVVGEEPK